MKNPLSASLKSLVMAGAVLLVSALLVTTLSSSPLRASGAMQPVPTFTPVGWPGDPLPPGVLQLIEPGQDTSLRLNASGIPYIAYMTSTELHLAICNSSTDCSNPVIRILDNSQLVNESVSLGLSNEGIPWISYYYDSSYDLKLAHCSDISCSEATRTPLDGTENVGTDNAITFDQSGFPVISYFDATHGDLKLARCTDANCNTFTIQTIDSTDRVGIATSIAIDSENIPIISYIDVDNHLLKLARCNNTTTCDAPTIHTIAPNVIHFFSAMQLDSNGIPVIAYIDNHHLTLVRCNTVACDAPTFSLIDNRESSGFWVSLVIDQGDIPLMSYAQGTGGGLTMARCNNNTTCDQPILQNLFLLANTGPWTSLDLNGSNPVISFTSNGHVYIYFSNAPIPFTPTPPLITPTSPPNATPAAFFSVTEPIVLTWNRITWAQGYIIEVALDSNFKVRVVNSEVSASTLSLPLSGLGNGHYYWRVRARRSTTALGDWSSTQQFVFSAPATATPTPTS